MASTEERFHEEWLGLVQPVDGLVVSIPALIEAQCLSRQPPEVQRKLADLCSANAETAMPAFISDWPGFLSQILSWPLDALLVGDALPDNLRLYVAEGSQIVKPTAALQDENGPQILLWDLGPENIALPLDRPETKTGPWEYPVSAKFDRLLRHTRVPIGIITNRTQVRLCYAPHGESSGSINFRVADMLDVGGRPILDALVMLLGATRLFEVAPERRLPAILAESRKRQANVTNELADQVFEALQILLAGFEAAAERDGREVLDAAYERGEDHLYGGLLTLLLRLVFVLYAEDRGLLPVEHPLYAAHLSLLGLFDELQSDQGNHPDTMSRRFGAYGRLLSLFRAIFLGVEHDDLKMPSRHGQLFSPHEYPFIEGWEGRDSAPIVDPADRAATRVPSVDDGTVFRVLEKLLILRRQRLSYRALDVEQIGSVYEALMGYHVIRLPAEAVCVRVDLGSGRRPIRVWLTADEVLAHNPATRTRWLKETTGMQKGQAERLHKALSDADANRADQVLSVLDDFAMKGSSRRHAGSLVIQPGTERRRTSSHYTPRSLTAPIVQKTLDPLLRALGSQPSSEKILSLKICDPAMGSGAFLVEACRYLADQVVLAWTRERRHDLLAGREDVTLLARRLVAQRCLYGVDKNAYAVNLAKLSLWLVTLAKDLPFTFVDHALRHGDSLVGLSFEQIMSFHWKPGKQLELCRNELESTLNEAIKARLRILELASDPSPAAQKEKEWLLRDAEDALDRVRLLGDLVVGAFFSSEKATDREHERDQRLDRVLEWLRAGGSPPGELIEMRQELGKRIPAFHWMAEYPEIFWVERADPLNGGRIGEAAWIDAFVGNPPFMGGSQVSGEFGDAYRDWIQQLHAGACGNADYSAHFFRRADTLLGRHGSIGFIATDTIAQGDTRATGLQYLLRHGLRICAATRSMSWPGVASVTVAVVHIEKGQPPQPNATKSLLDGVEVASINSRLRAGYEMPDPVSLSANAGLSFSGSKPYGLGFVLTPEERQVLVRKDNRNAERIFPYLGGEEVNTSPTQDFERYIINFGEMSLEDASGWPDLLAIVREKVKPERDQNNREVRKKYWWRFGESAAALYETLAGLKRCLVIARDPKHFCFSFQPIGRVFTEKLYVIPCDSISLWTALSSRVHIHWALLLGRTTGGAGTPSYSTTDCLDPFPFPQPDPRTKIPALEDVGYRLYDARAAHMVATQQGLTQTYNKLKDPDRTDPEIVRLRELHVEMDRTVLTAYGWTDLVDKVPPFTTPQTEADKVAVAAFDAAVIDRLFALNAERAAAEALAGKGTKLPKQNAAKKPVGKATAKKVASKQATLFSCGEDDD